MAQPSHAAHIQSVLQYCRSTSDAKPVPGPCADPWFPGVQTSRCSWATSASTASPRPAWLTAAMAPVRRVVPMNAARICSMHPFAACSCCRYEKLSIQHLHSQGPCTCSPSFLRACKCCCMCRRGICLCGLWHGGCHAAACGSRGSSGARGSIGLGRCSAGRTAAARQAGTHRCEQCQHS